jgi:hypothetical protein
MADNVSDLAFFVLLVKRGSLVATAQERGATPPAVSKRLAAIEQRLGALLLQRTTRRIGLTPKGDVYLVEGARMLDELEALEHTVTGSKAMPKGRLRVCSSLGFGRNGNRQGARTAGSQRWRMRVGLGLGWPRNRDAIAVCVRGSRKDQLRLSISIKEGEQR